MSSKKNTYKKIDNEQGFYLDPKTKIIYFIKSIEGKIVKFSCKTENIVTAKRFANKELKRKLGANKKNVTPLLDYWIDKYVKMREESDLSNSAIKNSRTALNQSKGFFKKYRAEEIDKDLWAEFYDWYKSEFNNDFENVFKYFRNFLNWLSEEKHQGRALNFRVPTLKNPDSKKTRRARKKKKERVFDEAEFVEIYNSCDLREQTLILLMYTMAFRVESDALSARWSQFRLKLNPPIYVFGEFDNKAGLEGRQAIHEVTLKHLIKWKEICGSREYVFRQESNASKHLKRSMIDWDKIRKQADLGWHWTPHTFRHTCLTRLAENGYPQHLISKCFRISPKEFMETYAHLTPEGILKMQNAIGVKL